MKYRPIKESLFQHGAQYVLATVKGNENKSFNELSECAKGYDLGKVTVNVWVDNKPIAQVKAEDLKTTNLINVTELSTKGFNITIPENSNLAVDYPGYSSGCCSWMVHLFKTATCR